MSIKLAKLGYVSIQIVHIYDIFTNLKLWVAVARHNFKWVKIQILYRSALRVTIL